MCGFKIPFLDNRTRQKYSDQISRKWVEILMIWFKKLINLNYKKNKLNLSTMTKHLILWYMYEIDNIICSKLYSYRFNVVN